MIDLMKNITFNSRQIEKHVDNQLRAVFTSRDELIVNRVLAAMSLSGYTPKSDEVALITLAQTAIPESVAYGDEFRTKNTLLINAIAHEEAVIRLGRYLLSEGVDEVLAVDAVSDEITGETTQEAIDYVLPITPLDALVDKTTYDENNDPIVEQVQNPLILQDIAERLIAQTTVDDASQEVLSLVELRL